MVQHGGQGEHGSTKKRGERAQQDAQNNDGFETDVRSIEVRNDEANPHTQGQRDTEEGQQADGLAGGAALGKQQTLKGKRPGSHRRDRRGYAQLDQQCYEDELRLKHALTLRQFPRLDMRPGKRL